MTFFAATFMKSFGLTQAVKPLVLTVVVIFIAYAVIKIYAGRE